MLQVRSNLIVKEIDTSANHSPDKSLQEREEHIEELEIQQELLKYQVKQQEEEIKIMETIHIPAFKDEENPISDI